MLCLGFVYCFFFFKQKTAYEMRISDWGSDVCSSDLLGAFGPGEGLSVVGYFPCGFRAVDRWPLVAVVGGACAPDQRAGPADRDFGGAELVEGPGQGFLGRCGVSVLSEIDSKSTDSFPMISSAASVCFNRSEEHTSEL